MKSTDYISYPKNSLESIITNPGFHYLGQSILRHLNIESLLSLRLVNHSSKVFVENPRFWLKKLKYKNSDLMEVHEAWSSLIQKVEEKNPELKQNVVLNLIKLVDNSQDRRELFPLNILSLFGDLPLVDFIINNNMVECLSKKSKYGSTPTHFAAGRGHTEIVKALVGCNNNLNPANNLGFTPIHYAALKGHTETVKVLSSFCVIDDPNTPNNDGLTPIHLAAQEGHTETVKALIGFTDKPNAPTNVGQTPIHSAAFNGHTETVKVLTEYMENPNAPCNAGQTPIHYAALNGHIVTVKALIDCTDTPNSPDNFGVTPIHLAAGNGHTKIVNVLMEYTDNPNAPDNFGVTPYQKAKNSKHFNVMFLLFCRESKIYKYMCL